MLDLARRGKYGFHPPQVDRRAADPKTFFHKEAVLKTLRTGMMKGRNPFRSVWMVGFSRGHLPK